MNRIPLHRQREPWMTAIAAVLGLALIAVMLAWLWRPSKLVQAVPGPLEASAPVAAAPEDALAAPAQARRALAVSGRWSRLSAGDQAILAPLKDDWAELSVDQRLKWLELSMRFPSMAVDEQQRVQDRMMQWARMTTAERGAARLNFQEIRQFTAKERLEQWEAYQELAPQERKELAIRAQAAVQSPAVPKRSDSSGPVPKSSSALAETVAGAVPRPVSGTLVQAPIGATTRLVTQLPQPSTSAGSGPRLAVGAGAVDPVTLLPQARAARPSPSSEPAASAADEAVPAAALPASDPGSMVPGSGPAVPSVPAAGGTP
ncbi:MAG: DUF3106 domain-containing protein [Betaproteobacteria bacterium]|nr:DUF3106 domain-containing protein [Betaproteobacteria bacterium]